ncbi:MAG TPA: prepilin peptidase [Clostridia bacterium]|nr:prepilin peptidase [Clostridia bacterium]
MDLFWYFAAGAFLLGLTFGSFLNVCIYRLPRGMSVASPSRSFCPNCGREIAAFDNIPVLSWMLLRGRCRNCREPIKARYAIIELFTGLLFLASYVAFGGLTLASLKACVFCFVTLGLIFTDAETQLLPDAMTLPGFATGLAFSVVVPVDGILSVFAMDSAFAEWWRAPRLISLGDALVGAAIGAGLIYGIREFYFRVRGVEGMGFGDVKLMAMIGAFLGPVHTLLVIFAASLAGSIYGALLLASVYSKRLSRNRRLERGTASARALRSATLALRSLPQPFGVFLGSAAILTLFFGPRILAWYFRLRFE